MGDFEAGRSEPTLTTVLKVGMALQQTVAFANVAAPAIRDRVIRRIDVTLADLLEGGDGLVALTDDLTISAADLANVARGEPFPSPRRHEDKLQRSGLAEQRLAKALGLSNARLAELSSQLWRSTFSEERDRRAGPGANRQKKARVSRDLRADIEKAIADGDD